MSQKSTQIPKHLGLIIDGNRRWAKERGLSSIEGHKQGYETLKTIGKEAIKQGVEYVSAYVFSTENWQRSKEEIDYLMKLLIWVFKHEINQFDKEGIRLRVIGSEEHLSKPVIQAIGAAQEKTKDNKKGTLVLCLNYGGQQEMADAATKIINKNPKIDVITPDMIEQNLYSADVPPVDLIIRTSGEERLSNFMLWRAAYSELYFSNKLWPDFTPADLSIAFAEYARRQRRYGS